MSDALSALRVTHQELIKDYKLQHIRIEDQRRQIKDQDAVQGQLRQDLVQLQGGWGALVIQARRVDDAVLKYQCASVARRILTFVSLLTCDQRPDGMAIDSKALEDALEEDKQMRVGMKPVPIVTWSSSSGTGRWRLRHALSSFLAEEVLNSFQVSPSRDINRFLYLLYHKMLKAQPKSVAPAVWRQQTIRAATTGDSFLTSHAHLWIAFEQRFPSTVKLFTPVHRQEFINSVLDAASVLSTMMHGSPAISVPLYRAYVPNPGSPVDFDGMDLQKRCALLETGDDDTVGCCTGPGVVKLGWGFDGELEMKSIVKKAQVVCDCVFNATNSPRPQRSLLPAYGDYSMIPFPS